MCLLLRISVLGTILKHINLSKKLYGTVIAKFEELYVLSKRYSCHYVVPIAKFQAFFIVFFFSRFGSAFTMQVCRETSYKDLQKLLLKEMASMLHDDVLTTEQDIPLFGIRLADASDMPQYLDPTVELPLFTDPVDQALAMSGDQPHVKFILEWDLHAKNA